MKGNGGYKRPEFGFCDYKNDKKFDCIKKRIFKKRLLSVLLALLIEAAFVTVGFFAANVTEYAQSWAVPVFTGIAGALVSYGVCLKFISDRDYEGDIVKIEAVMQDKAKTTYGQMANGRKKIVIFTLYVHTDDDKIRSCSAIYDSYPDKYFKEGDRVRHYSGLKLVEKQDKTNDRTVICNSCGNYPLIEEYICPICGSELLK